MDAVWSQRRACFLNTSIEEVDEILEQQRKPGVAIVVVSVQAVSAAPTGTPQNVFARMATLARRTNRRHVQRIAVALQLRHAPRLSQTIWVSRTVSELLHGSVVAA